MEPFYKTILKAIENDDAWVLLPSGDILVLRDGSIVDKKHAPPGTLKRHYESAAASI